MATDDNALMPSEQMGFHDATVTYSQMTSFYYEKNTVILMPKLDELNNSINDNKITLNTIQIDLDTVKSSLQRIEKTVTSDINEVKSMIKDIKDTTFSEEKIQQLAEQVWQTKESRNFKQSGNTAAWVSGIGGAISAIVAIVAVIISLYK